MVVAVGGWGLAVNINSCFVFSIDVIASNEQVQCGDGGIKEKPTGLIDCEGILWISYSD